MNDPEFRIKLSQAVDSHRELDWIFSNYSYNSNVPLNETPIINFRNYRYKIVEIFVMTYKQEKAVLDVEIATPDVLIILGTYAEYKLLDRLVRINEAVIHQNHSWSKILALAHGDVRLLVNLAFVVMHLFAGDIVALSDNEIVYCYILAAAVISSIDKPCRARLDKDIQKRGVRRPQVSITDRAAHTSSFGRSNTKIPKDSSKAEAAYVKAFEDILMDPEHRPANDENRKVQASNLDVLLPWQNGFRSGKRAFSHFLTWAKICHNWAVCSILAAPAMLSPSNFFTTLAKTPAPYRPIPLETIATKRQK